MRGHSTHPQTEPHDHAEHAHGDRADEGRLAGRGNRTRTEVGHRERELLERRPARLADDDRPLVRVAAGPPVEDVAVVRRTPRQEPVRLEPERERARDVAELLHVPAGSPVLRCERITQSVDGDPVRLAQLGG